MVTGKELYFTLGKNYYILRYFKGLSVETLLVQTKISGISVAVIVEKLITLVVVNNRVLVNIEKLLDDF